MLSRVSSKVLQLSSFRALQHACVKECIPVMNMNTKVLETKIGGITEQEEGEEDVHPSSP